MVKALQAVEQRSQHIDTLRPSPPSLTPSPTTILPPHVPAQEPTPTKTG